MKKNIIKITQCWSDPNFKDNLFNITYKWTDDDNQSHFVIKKFQDYFYYPKSKIEDLSKAVNDKNIEVKFDEIDNEYKSIYNDDLIKVLIASLKFKYKLFDDKKRTPLETEIKHNSFMLDVSPELKFINQNKHIQWSQNRHIIYFDIETWFDNNHPEQNKPQFALQPITSIQMYSNLSKEYFVILWHPSYKNELEFDVVNEITNIEDGEILNLIKCKDEIILFQTFIKLFKMMQPDIITGWFSDGYDVPYIINRAEVLGLKKELNSISPGKWVSTKHNAIKRVFYNTIKGVDHVDMMNAVASLNVKLPNNKLDTAAEIILGNDMTKIKTSSWKDWKDDLDGFIKYGFRDVQILKKIDEKLDIFNFFYNLQDVTNITQLKQKFSQTTLIDHFFISRYFDDNTKIFPTNNRTEQTPFQGAYVKKPVSVGVSRNVSIFDYASLYPTTMMAMNLSPETFIISHKIAVDEGIDIDEHIIPELKKANIEFIDTGYSDELVEGRYLFFAHKTSVGILPESLYELYNGRKELKAQMKKCDNTSKEYNILDKRQYAIKIILNSIYGAQASLFFRLNNFRVADATTYYARKLIHLAEDYFEGRFKWTKMSKYLNKKYGVNNA